MKENEDVDNNKKHPSSISSHQQLVFLRNGIPVKISPPRVSLDDCHLLIQTVLAQGPGDD